MRAALLFGKLPSHGDFIARGLSDAGMAAWDDYLTASLSDAATLEDFDELYAVAPAWRFVTDVDGQAMCGVIAPSVDKVGRQFPILAGVAAGENSEMLIDACEAHLYDAFANGLDADALFGALQGFPDAPIAPDVPAAGWYLEDEDRVVIDRLDGNRPPALIRHMVEAARSS